MAMTAKSISLAILELALAVGLSACISHGHGLIYTVDHSPSSPDPIGEPWDRAEGADVYIVGNGDRLFKNGVSTRLGALPNATSWWGRSVFVDGNDVYVAGNAREICNNQLSTYAVMWKNDVPRRLGRSSGKHDYSMALSIFVAGGHVYVSGFDDYPNPNNDGRTDRMPVLWVDGEPHVLLTGNIYGGEANSVFVTPGGDVYVGGFVDWSAHIWINGVRQPNLFVADGYATQTRIDSVFVDGDDVYAVGSDYVSPWNRAVLFKNGRGRVLADYGWANSVFVSGGVVYVGGDEVNMEPNGVGTGNRGYAVLWKDGEKHRLTEGVYSEASVTSVFVSNGDVYMSGYEQVTKPSLAPPGTPENRSYLWINGEAIDMESSYGIKTAGSVFVERKDK